MLRVLILGGTGDASELATKASAIEGVLAIASFAGRTKQPIIPIENFRVGGFGGVAGLVSYLQETKIDLLIDATHPFANQISWNAATAANEVGIPRLLLNRPPWEKLEADNWVEVESIEAAAEILGKQPQRVFLTIGRQQLLPFSHLDNIWFLMRLIDPPEIDAFLPKGKLLCDRGPFALKNERKLLVKNNIDTIVSKNSGGDATYAKIIAARELGIKVVMVQRPQLPNGEQVESIDAAIAWLLLKLH
jgi:precorrin-6A/cobalt-precorrin-6A reductase